MALFGSGGTTATANEIYAVARAAGFSVQDAVTATAISLAESGGHTNSWNPNPPDDSVGLWQINLIGSLASRGTHAEMSNPQLNAKMALALRSGGNGWANWTMYTNGVYRQYLPAAQTAAAEVGNDPQQIDSVVGSLMARLNLPTQAAASGDSASTTGDTRASGSSGPGSIPIIGGVLSATDAIAAPFRWLLVPGHWWAIAFVVVGALLVVGGALVYLRPEIEQATAQAGRMAAAAVA